MTKNGPVAQRRVIDRPSSVECKGHIVDVVNGRVGLGSDDPATLVVIEFSFVSLKPLVRIKSASISLQFAGVEGDDDPQIVEIAPRGKFTWENKKAVEVASADVAEIRQAATMVGSTGLKGRDSGRDNLVVWEVKEDQATKSGIPARFRTALLLKRNSNDPFHAAINIRTDVSGFSFQAAQGSQWQSGDDLVIFDPRNPSKGRDELLASQENLRSVRLLSLVEAAWVAEKRGADEEATEAAVAEEINQIEALEREARGETTEDTGEAQDTDQASGCESWFVDLWDTTSTDFKREKPKALDQKSLEKYFSWIKETIPSATIARGDQQRPRQHQPDKANFCNLIATVSTKNGAGTFNDLEGLLSQPPVNVLSTFFELPDDYSLLRRHDRGTCQIVTDKSDGKDRKEYILQTPFYSGGFWSLLLYCEAVSGIPASPSRLSGVIQVDNDVDFCQIFGQVHNLVKRYGHHHMLLPLQLLKNHHATTSKAFHSIQKDVTDVDTKLMQTLETDKEPKHASQLYRELSKTLHKCTMNLVELGRRRQFEKELATSLQEDVQNDGELSLVVSLYANMSKSRDSDIETLPGKIESQRNVLYNLIAQHDSFMQARLAREALRDSKAMKTLSVLTILFLPGAFVATVFSTNMFGFESKSQQIRVYFAIVIPLTLVLMIGWALWLARTPLGHDVELGREIRRAATFAALKEEKND